MVPRPWVLVWLCLVSCCSSFVVRRLPSYILSGARSSATTLRAVLKNDALRLPPVELVASSPQHIPLLRRLDAASGGVSNVIYAGNSLPPNLSISESTRRPVKVFVNVKEDEAAASLPPSQADLDAIERTDYELVFYASELSESALESGPTVSSFSHPAWLLKRLVSHASLPPIAPGSPSTFTSIGPNTFFLSLTAPTVESYASPATLMPSLCFSSDALEFRVDLLSNNSSRCHVLRSLQSLRLLAAPHSRRNPSAAGAGEFGGLQVAGAMPVIYTCRSRNQAGTYPDDPPGISSMFRLLSLGLRAGVEYLDVEACWDAEKYVRPLRSRVVGPASRYGPTMLIGSHHVVGRCVSDAEANARATDCLLEGNAHCLKLVLSCGDDEETGHKQAGRASRRAVDEAVRGGRPAVPVVALALGEKGRQSRIENERFTPVTHPDLPFKAAPGQLSTKEIMEERVKTGIVNPTEFAIVGHKIDYTLSPKMHNEAFRVCGLPHFYGKVDCETVEEFVNGPLFKRNTFGGGSVTIPHKTAIMKYLDWISPEATEIGAVNTLKVDYDSAGSRVVKGFNTDWKGIYTPIRSRLNDMEREDGESPCPADEYVVIVGGGGAAKAAAYAARELGFKLLFWNRTPAKAGELKDAFGGEAIDDLQNISEEVTKKVRCVISTIPAAAQFTIPDRFLHKNLILFDCNYKPYTTPFLEQGEKFPGIKLIRGGEMLWEQGSEQFKIWTGRNAPMQAMKNIVEAGVTK